MRCKKAKEVYNISNKIEEKLMLLKNYGTTQNIFFNITYVFT